MATGRCAIVTPAAGAGLALVAALACAPVLAADAAAGYPNRPIRVIVPFSAGTTTDVLMRMVGQKLTDAWGQQVVVDNRAGAASILGMELGARATPDGYNLVTCGFGAMAINPSLYPKLPYHPLRDFAPLTNMAMTPQTLVTGPQPTAFRTVQEFVVAARSRPGQMSYATFGAGSANHLTMEMLQRVASISLNAVPYKGTPQAQLDVVSGQVNVMFDAIAAVLPHVRAGRLRALGVATLERSPLAPELPTIVEGGFPGFEVVGWIGIAAPAKTPGPILDRLGSELMRILATAEIRERFAALGLTPVGNSRQDFARYVESELERWTRAVKDAGVKLE
jgi:tripartite-type tricarboxylate transporter receptor subunit TctC